MNCMYTVTAKDPTSDPARVVDRLRRIGIGADDMTVSHSNGTYAFECMCEPNGTEGALARTFAEIRYACLGVREIATDMLRSKVVDDAIDDYHRRIGEIRHIDRQAEFGAEMPVLLAWRGGRELLGFQVCDEQGKPLQGTAADPTGQAWFDVMAANHAVAVVAAHGKLGRRLHLMPVFVGDMDHPALVTGEAAGGDAA